MKKYNTEAEIIGQPLTRLIPCRYRDRHLAGMSRMQAAGKLHLFGKTVEREEPGGCVMACHSRRGGYDGSRGLSHWPYRPALDRDAYPIDKA